MNLFPYIAGFIFLATEIVLNRMLRSTAGDKQGTDKQSISLIWVTVILSITIAGYVAGKFQAPIFSNHLHVYVGVALIFIGIIIRFVAVYSLGQFFTVDVTIRKSHRLKKNGLFKYIRHPNYAALLISFLGVGITDNNWYSLLIIFIPILTAFIVRINIEEKVLIEHFGVEYLNYKRSTKRLLPFIY